MEKITTSNIRNVCLLGHGGSGKTSVAEAMLFLTKGTDRLGKPSEGNTVCDYDPEEIKRGYSVSTAIAPVMWKNIKINMIDSPGYLDFVGEVLQSVRVADSALIVVDGKNGAEVGTELAWDYAVDAKIPKSFFINKVDDPEARFDKTFNELRDLFGVSVCPLLIPIEDGKGFLNLIDMKAFTYDVNGKHIDMAIPASFADTADEYRNILYESIAETSEELMEKFFAEEEITREEAVDAIHVGILNGSIAPVICGSSTKMWCIDSLLDIIIDSYPMYTSRKTETTDEGDVAISETGTVSIFVFKTIADPFVGKMSFFKVMSGELSNDLTLKNSTTGTSEKMAHIYTIKGKKQTEVDVLCCGDIGMTAKLADTNTNDTLTNSPNPIQYKKVAYPEPFLTMAVIPKVKGEEDKISAGINKIIEEDYTIRFENNAETKQLLVSGLGDIHLDVVISRLDSRYKTGAELIAPRIAYRETIKKKFQAEGKHKKQSGGHGQYGHVRIEFGPGEDIGLTFTETVVGGSVPKGYFPAVEKGLLEAMQKGVLAGYPVVNLAANLYDGSYHDVDSSEMAFKLAANLAYKDGLVKANPIILEPIGELKVQIPDSIVGDIIGDINKRRGRVLGMHADDNKKGYQIVEAEIPKSEMTDYTITLRALSQGKGKFTFYFIRYDEAPPVVAQKIIADAKLLAAEEEK
ncbi:MAG: elongation factor G [Oscillospiraceae bacterium]|nr:elongation factor G [Oscillospiraceae bacterium]